MKIVEDKDMKSVLFEFENSKTPGAKPRLEFKHIKDKGIFNLIVEVNKTSYTPEMTIDLGNVTIEEIEEIADILKTMSGIKNTTNDQLIFS